MRRLTAKRTKMPVRAHRLQRRCPGAMSRAAPRPGRGRRFHVAVQRNIGMLILAIWLILYGVTAMAALALPAPLMAILALLAGILILVGR